MADAAVHLIPPSQYPHLISLLLPHLPSSVILIRHLQWQHQSPTANIYITFLITTTPGTSGIALPRTFAIARLDRAAFRGTGLYIHSSLEVTTLSPFTPAETSFAKAAVLNLCSHLHQIDPPSSSSAIDVMFAGDLHTTTAHLLLQHNLIAALTDANPNNSPGPYNKYVIRYSRASSLPSLPVGLDYTTMTPADYALVMQENKLIRSVKTFDNTPTAAIRLVDSAAFMQGQKKGVSSTSPNMLDTLIPHEGQIIAWAIITSYGSIRTLHVQPAFRGLGLARKVVLKLLQDSWPAEFVAGAEDVGGEREATSLVFSTDIDPENQASIRTFAPVGELLQVNPCYWVEVDLGAAEKALKTLSSRSDDVTIETGSGQTCEARAKHRQ